MRFILPILMTLTLGCAQNTKDSDPGTDTDRITLEGTITYFTEDYGHTTCDRTYDVTGTAYTGLCQDCTFAFSVTSTPRSVDEPCSGENEYLTLTGSSDHDELFFAHAPDMTLEAYSWYTYYLYGYDRHDVKEYYDVQYTNVLFTVDPTSYTVLGSSDERIPQTWDGLGDVSTEVVLTSDHLDWTFESTKSNTIAEVAGRVSVHGSFDLLE
jgi:hypothetical protein